MNEDTVTITLLHSNDVHSHFEAASRIAGYIKKTKKRVPQDRLLVVDCGDFLDRAMPETEGTDGAANRALLEKTGYDAVVIGNNEGLTYTRNQLDELYAGMPIPVVCSNMLHLGTGVRPEWMVPELTLDKSGVKIGLIGLTAAFNDYYRLLGWEAEDPVASAMRQVARLRQDVDVLIVLSHLGIRLDERLATEVPGIDLILGGHTHHLLEKPLEIGNTYVCAAGKFGQYVGHLELTYRKGDRKLSVTGGSLPTDDLPTDEESDRLLEDYRSQAYARMDRVVASLAEPLDWRTDGESPLATLLACSVRKTTGAEIGLVNAGQLLGDVPAGPVTERFVHGLCPSPINPCAVTLRGEQIRRSLEESLLPAFYELGIKGFGFRGEVLGTLCMDGMEATADLSKPEYARVADVRVGGEPLDDNRDYAVGTLDMFTFGVGYVGLKEGRDVRYFLPDFIRDGLAEAMGDPELLEDCKRPRWTILE